MAEITVTKENFNEEILKSDIPVLLDFWATWCGPCKMIAPVIEEIAEEQNGKIKVGKINVDEESSLAAAFNISSIPTLVMMKNGEVTNMSVGYQTKEQIEKLL